MLDENLFNQIVEVIQKIDDGDLNHEIPAPTDLSQDAQKLVSYLNDNIKNLRQLRNYILQIKDEIPQLVDGIQDVLQTIEKSTIRVLDSTDGILEQHDSIEKHNGLLKQNPALNRVFGPRLDKITQSQDKARMFAFDIIQSQEFQELTRKQTDQLVGVLEDLKNRLLGLQALFNLKEDGSGEEVGTHEVEEQEGETPVRADQDLVDQLLAEFGI